jgi:ABC-type phosphate transport system substrate-binding protein
MTGCHRGPVSMPVKTTVGFWGNGVGRFRTLLLVLIAAAQSAAVRRDAPSSSPAFRVIVNPQNPTDAAEKKFLTDLFLKKLSHWSGLEPVRPVDLRPDSPARRAFTEQVLRRSVADVKHYWQQRVFSGRDVPPPELDSDAGVVAYVLKYQGAVGYVSGTGDLRGAKVLQVR